MPERITVRVVNRSLPGSRDARHVERSGLDQETYLLGARRDSGDRGRLCPLAPRRHRHPAEVGVPLDNVQGALAATAPVVGSARVVSAARSIGDDFGLEGPGEADR